MNAVDAMPLAFIGFSLLAALTWGFSYRPRSFVRMFVPREELRAAVRRIVRDPDFGRGARFIALLELGLAILFGGVAVWLWLA